MDPRRAARVTEALREELEELIAFELEDPRVQGVQVVEVIISPDARHAKIRVRAEDQQAIEGLDHARHFLRRELAHRLDIFRVPDLHFELAVAPELDQRAQRLLKRIRRGRPRDGQAAGPEHGS